MTDPDAPSPSEPSMREWVHWSVIFIHRYMFLPLLSPFFQLKICFWFQDRRGHSWWHQSHKRWQTKNLHDLVEILVFIYINNSPSLYTWRRRYVLTVTSFFLAFESFDPNRVLCWFICHFNTPCMHAYKQSYTKTYHKIAIKVYFSRIDIPNRCVLIILFKCFIKKW